MTAARPERLLGMIAVLLLGAVVVAVVALGSNGPGADPAPSDHRSGRGSPIASLDPAWVSAEVERVVDGDTVIVRIDGVRERLRYIGIDAPELADAEAGEPAECGADEAREAHAALVEGARLLLERDVSDRDRFGRLLRHARLADDPGRLVTEALVAEGAVEARSYPPDTRHDARLDDAERVARASGLGIWGRC